MSRLALRSLLSRPLRTALTTLAILLGVAMISGTYVLTDQITNAFDGIFSTAYKGTAAVVTPKNALGGVDDESAALTMSDVSFASKVVSPATGTVIVLVVSPAANVSVPDVAV